MVTFTHGDPNGTLHVPFYNVQGACHFLFETVSFEFVYLVNRTETNFSNNTVR